MAVADLHLFRCTMKTIFVLLVFTLSLTSAFGEEKKGVYQVSTKEVLLFSAKDKPEERLALLFTGFSGATATYKWMYFNPLTSDWVTGSSRLQEIYDKVPVGNGINVTAVPGHNTTIQAGRISIQWSRGSKDSAWIYYPPEHLILETLPANQFYKLQ
jgi:hypothetical protein